MIQVCGHILRLNGCYDDKDDLSPTQKIMAVALDDNIRPATLAVSAAKSDLFTFRDDDWLSDSETLPDANIYQQPMAL